MHRYIDEVSYPVSFYMCSYTKTKRMFFILDRHISLPEEIILCKENLGTRATLVPRVQFFHWVCQRFTAQPSILTQNTPGLSVRIGNIQIEYSCEFDIDKQSVILH